MKRLLRVILSAMVVLALPTIALAEDYTGQENWKVTYTSGGTMTDNYSKEEFIDRVGELEPGDSITFTVNLSHENKTAADWYMENEVIKSLEEGAQHDGKNSAYGYELKYKGPSSSKTLYSSEKGVGGDTNDAGTEGLGEATDALDEWLYLDNLKNGEKATMTLKVTLNGETESNAYFDTLAQIKLRFAVEADTPEDNPNKKEEKREVVNQRQLVRTGDELRLFPYYVAMLVSGILLLGLAIVSVRERRKNREEGRR